MLGKRGSPAWRITLASLRPASSIRLRAGSRSSTGTQRSRRRGKPMSMMPWLKLWNEILDKEKIQRLDSCSFKAWINVLCCAARNNLGGVLQPSESLAFLMRITVTEVEAHLKKLVEAGLVDRTRTGYAVHDWAHWQPCSKTDAERKADERRRKKESRDMSRDKADNDRDKSRDVSPECHASRARSDSDSDSDKKDTEKNVLRRSSSVAPPADAREGKTPAWRKPRLTSEDAKPAVPDDPMLARIAAEDERQRRLNGDH